MSRDFDDIYKKIDQSHKELYKQDNHISKDIINLDKNQEKILLEIKDIKKEIKSISFKVDTILEILNNFTIMLTEETEEDNGYDFDSGETWVPNGDDEKDEAYEEDEWNNYEDES